jgi:hypothetical protein
MVGKTHASEWQDLFMTEFSKETPRAAVILSVAMLEQALETLLKIKLVPISTTEDKLFDGPYAPIASFSAKIDLAYRIGLISLNLCRDLHLIRQIRNDFAHDISNCSFENVRTKDRILILNRSSGITERFPKMREKFPEGPRGDFQISVSWILHVLTSGAEKVGPILSASLEFGYNKGLKEQNIQTGSE